jgi:lipopolysaccharide export system permease protein
LGCAFGVHIGRRESSKGIAIVIVLATMYLITYFVAKGIDYNLVAAISLYTIPHGILWMASGISLWRSAKGLES